MPLIDVHVHLYPPEINAAPGVWAEAVGERHWSLLCARIRKSGAPAQGFPNVKDLLRAMDAADVERAVLQGWYWEKHDTCVLQNRFFAKCLRQHPRRFSACATLQPLAGTTAVKEELSWIAQNGFCGLGELSPHSQGVPIDHPGWDAVLRGAEAMSFPVLLHVTEAATKAYPGRVLTPLKDFVHLATLFPKVIFVLAHWGARLPLDAALGETVRNLRNVFFDTAASPLLYGSSVFQEMISAIGAERILFGSDYPLILFPKEEREPSIASFAASAQDGLSGKERAAIFRGTAQCVFHL